ncbi:flagellar assembly peptidoglycan hydrolase FlgJ [Photobacterium damselae subsp. piscicida]|nr:flagellar assembly peptidoglycan hydrolase FlgJ [Photobacterium damselae subsp. piscicida]
MKQIEPGFINDLTNLDWLRAGIGKDKEGSLRQAAQQFESLFTQMLFKSMRNANSAFESDLMSSNNTKFFQQMRDEQMASELSTQGNLGLADMIVKQLGGESENSQSGKTLPVDKFAVRPISQPSESYYLSADERAKLYQDKYDIEPKSAEQAKPAVAPDGVGQLSDMTDKVKTQSEPSRFDSPKGFVAHMKPYAFKASRALGVDPTMLIAQAALETGWGKKVIQNAAGLSHNLFNIKADPRWGGIKLPPVHWNIITVSQYKKMLRSVRIILIKKVLMILYSS